MMPIMIRWLLLDIIGQRMLYFNPKAANDRRLHPETPLPRTSSFPEESRRFEAAWSVFSSFWKMPGPNEM